MSALTDLIDKLKDRQKTLGMNETQFAEMLGRSRATWFLIKKGEAEPGLDFLSAVVKVFPDLQPEVLAIMRGAPLENTKTEAD